MDLSAISQAQLQLSSSLLAGWCLVDKNALLSDPTQNPPASLGVVITRCSHMHSNSSYELLIPKHLNRGQNHSDCCIGILLFPLKPPNWKWAWCHSMSLTKHESSVWGHSRYVLECCGQGLPDCKQTGFGEQSTTKTLCSIWLHSWYINANPETKVRFMSGPRVQDSTQVSVGIFRMHDSCYMAALCYPFLPQDNQMNIWALFKSSNVSR